MTEQDLLNKLVVNGKQVDVNFGTMISRVICHYWYHNGEVQAQRQLMGHKNLTNFVTDDIATVGGFYLD